MMHTPRWRTYLRLGRVSNLPTVWTNAIAGSWLSSVHPRPADVALVAAATSLFYCGGMFLNDAFDREIDARERPERPIPAGHIRAAEVFAVGFGLLAAGEALLVARALLAGWTAAPFAGLALAGAIVAYDGWHKQNPLSPMMMAACRALVYVTAALAASGRVAAPVLAGALLLFGYVVGLTYVAKGARVSHATVARMLAGISVLDALLVAGAGAPRAALLTALGFPATLLLQRLVRGT
jgi:4-hydroxybenzoate polyprenyltransferase